MPDRIGGPRRGWITPAVWSAVAAGAALVAIAALPMPAGARAAAAAVVAAIAVAATAVRERSRAAKLEELERHARALLSGEPGDGDGKSEELTGLRRALDQLGGRISAQLKELAKKTRNLEALIDAIDEPLLATNDREQVLLCNRAAEELFGAGPGQLAGRPIAALFTQEEVLEMHAAARRGEVRGGRVRMMTAEGTRVFQVSAAPVPVAWGEGVFGAVLLLRDVTELDRAVQIKSDFVANASHELRTPVAAIRGAVETLIEGLRDEPPLPAEMRDRLLEMVRTHAERLEEIIRDLLDLSRLESPEFQVEAAPVDLGEVATTLRSMFEGVCRARRLELEFRFDPALEGMRTDPKVLMLVLRNLVENATKFAHEGTRVTVAARRVSRESARVFPRSADEGEGVVRFEVSDRGIGIPLHLRDRVFERYFQVDPARSGPRRGSGLGLAIVKHAVKGLGGEVGLESVWGEGTTVWFEVPVAFGEASGAEVTGTGEEESDQRIGA